MNPFPINFTSFLTGMGMVLDMSGTAVPPRPHKPHGSELTSIGEDFRRVGEFISIAVVTEEKVQREQEATQLKLGLGV